MRPVKKITNAYNLTCNIKNRFQGISLCVIFFENHKSSFLPVLIIVQWNKDMVSTEFHVCRVKVAQVLVEHNSRVINLGYVDNVNLSCPCACKTSICDFIKKSHNIL